MQQKRRVSSGVQGFLPGWSGQNTGVLARDESYSSECFYTFCSLFSGAKEKVMLSMQWYRLKPNLVFIEPFGGHCVGCFLYDWSAAIANATRRNLAFLHNCNATATDMLPAGKQKPGKNAFSVSMVLFPRSFDRAVHMAHSFWCKLLKSCKRANASAQWSACND